MTMKAIAKQWSKEDKFLMLKATDKIHNILKELDDPLKSAFVTELINNAVQDDAGIAKIAMINNKGRLITDLKDKTNRIRAITEGMHQSNVNLVLFRDDDEVWMQYYMGKFLGRPTLIICKDEDREILKHYKVKDKLFIVENYNNIDADKLGKMLQEIALK